MKNILLIGLGRFGKHVAYQLNELGHEVMAVDENENLVNEILPYVTDAQIGDSTNENFLESLGIKNYYICFLSIGGNHIHDYIEVDDSHAIFEVEVPGDWIGKTIGELDIRKKYSISILAIKTDGKMNMAIGPDMELSSEDTLLVLGTYRDMQKCFRI